MLDDSWGEGLRWCTCVIHRWGDYELFVVRDCDGRVAVGQEVHDGVFDNGVRQRVSGYIPASSVPLEELGVRDENAVSSPAGEYFVGIGHVDEGPAFSTVLVANVETDVVFHVKFTCAFVVL